MNKLVVFIIALFIVFMLIFGFRWLMRPGTIEYSNNPADWVDRTDEGVMVDVNEATRGKGEYNDFNQQLLLPTAEETAFAYEGIYRGNFFGRRFFGPDGKTLMEITPNLIPGDGILQGILIERVNNGVLETHIFIDDDWRAALGGNIGIVWGAEYEKARQFAFTEVRDGIYHDSVQDDASRLRADISVGGVQVGNMRPGGIDPAQADGIIMMAIH